MSIKHLGHSAHRFVLERLEQLQTSLEGLGQRLRENIAHLVGIHVGQAIRDSIGSALLRQPAEKVAERFDEYERGKQAPEDLEDDPIWGRPPSPPEPEPETKPVSRWGRWKTLLTGAIQVASVWLQHRAPRRSLPWLVGLGTLAGLVTLATGPLVGGVVTTAITAYLITRAKDSDAPSFHRMNGRAVH